MKVRSLLICCGAAVIATGCVNKDFDLKNLDLSVQLLSGLEVPINPDGETSVITAEELLGDSDLATGSIITSDQNISQQVSASEITGGRECHLEGTFEFDMGEVPEFLRNSGNDIKFSDKTNICVVVTNPLDCDVCLSFDIVTDGKDKKECTSPLLIPAYADNLEVCISMADYINYIPQTISVDNLMLKAADTKSAVPTAEKTVTFEIADAVITVDSSMEKGSTFSFVYELSVGKDLDIDLEELGIDNADTKGFELSGSIRTSLPVKFDASTVDGSDASASLTTIIAEDSEEWVEFTISVSAPEGFRAVKKLVVDFKAEALGDIDFENENHFIEFRSETLKLTEGIDLKF